MIDILIHTAINEILAGHNNRAFWKEQLESDFEGIIKLEYKGQTQEFYVEMKKQFDSCFYN